MPHYTGPIDPANRNVFGACRSLFGLGTMMLALALLLTAESNRAVAFRLEAGFFPPLSESAVQAARTEIVIAAVLVVLSTASALTAVIFRSTIAWRLIGGVTMLALILAGPLLWVCYDMAF
jgi:Na+/phosphate symporter